MIWSQFDNQSRPRRNLSCSASSSHSVIMASRVTAQHSVTVTVSFMAWFRWFTSIWVIWGMRQWQYMTGINNEVRDTFSRFQVWTTAECAKGKGSWPLGRHSSISMMRGTSAKSQMSSQCQVSQSDPDNYSPEDEHTQRTVIIARQCEQRLCLCSVWAWL